MRWIRHIAVVLAAALVAVAVPELASGSYHDVIRDCAQDSKLDRQYEQDELRQAHEHIPADIKEYTPCAEVIAAAIRNGGTGSSTGPRPGTSTGISTDSGAIAQTDDDVNALKDATEAAKRSGGSPLVTAGETIRPAAGRLDEVPASANELPDSLLVAILAVALLALVGGIVAARRRFREVARAPLRLVRR